MDFENHHHGKNEIIIGYHVQARGEIRLNEELAEYRLVRPEQLRPYLWDAIEQLSLNPQERHREELTLPAFHSDSAIAAFTSYAMTKLTAELKRGAGING